MNHSGSYKPRKLLDLICRACGEPFQATRPDARYHSPTCRQAISRAVRKSQRKKNNTATKGNQ